MARPRKNKPYFTKDTEEAIIIFNTSVDPRERNKVYEERIKYAFEKLAENLIHTFKFYQFDIPYEDVKNEVIAFLNEKIHKYEQGKGKAFSYFSIVAKNYLILHNNSNFNKFKNTEDLLVVDSDRNVVNEVLRDSYLEEKKDFMDLFVQYMENHLESFFNKEYEIMIADSLIEIFRNRKHIENFNRKALYVLIRERSQVKTQHITKVVNIFKELYETAFREYSISGKFQITPLKKSASK